MNVEEVFAKRMRGLRTARGLTQAVLADWMRMEGVDLPRSAVIGIESGNRHVRLEEAHAIAKALRVSLSDMTTEPKCDTCYDAPPEGFTCRSCGVAS